MMEPKKLIGMVIAAVLLIVALTLGGQVLTLMPQVQEEMRTTPT